jgi:hypothetical protein
LRLERAFGSPKPTVSLTVAAFASIALLSTHQCVYPSYSQELITRFQKELLSPYLSSNGSVEIDALNNLLVNIGHPQDCLTAEEQSVILKEAGSSNRSIALKKMVELIQ